MRVNKKKSIKKKKKKVEKPFSTGRWSPNGSPCCRRRSRRWSRVLNRKPYSISGIKSAREIKGSVPGKL